MKTFIMIITGFLLISSGIEAADITGTWKGTAPGPDGNPMEITYEFESTDKDLILLAGLGGDAHTFDKFAPGSSRRPGSLLSIQSQSKRRMINDSTGANGSSGKYRQGLSIGSY